MCLERTVVVIKVINIANGQDIIRFNDLYLPISEVKF